MNVHRDQHLELCAGLALGVLDDEERRAIEQHLATGCAACETELAAWLTDPRYRSISSLIWPSLMLFSSSASAQSTTATLRRAG